MVAFLRAGLETVPARAGTEVGFAMIENILRELQQPEYLHVLLNPLPLYGLAIALFGLVAATYLRSRGGQLAALVLVFASTIAVWPVVYHGDQAYGRVLYVVVVA